MPRTPSTGFPIGLASTRRYLPTISLPCYHYTVSAHYAAHRAFRQAYICHKLHRSLRPVIEPRVVSGLPKGKPPPISREALFTLTSYSFLKVGHFLSWLTPLIRQRQTSLIAQSPPARGLAHASEWGSPLSTRKHDASRQTKAHGMPDCERLAEAPVSTLLVSRWQWPADYISEVGRLFSAAHYQT